MRGQVSSQTHDRQQTGAVHHYAHLGSGGFGDVYQANDSKLGRSVAIKFLPEAFSHDSDRVARFEREARVLASLNYVSYCTSVNEVCRKRSGWTSTTLIRKPLRLPQRT